MAGIKFTMLALSLGSLILLSPSPAYGTTKPTDKTVSSETRKFEIHVKKGGGGGRGSGGGSGGDSRGGGYTDGGGSTGGGMVYTAHVGAGGGTQRSVAVRPPPSLLPSAVCSSLFLFASILI
ncbi:hypothetical protein ACJRO7_015240 [Eucalyptus globulus]|uniref:Glycine-rich protein n=1 Tax=Eucalyptus globulus TaxID=34317 RepID=A0ABD3L2Y0_EUCGL